MIRVHDNGGLRKSAMMKRCTQIADYSQYKIHTLWQESAPCGLMTQIRSPHAMAYLSTAASLANIIHRTIATSAHPIA